jgi:outer membrane protein assembly factor BamE
LIQDPFRNSRWDYFNSVTVGEKVITENKLTIYFNENGLVESWIVEKSTPEKN